MDSEVEFVAVDNPHANKLTVHILAAVAQHERGIISARISAALKAATARGKRCKVSRGRVINCCTREIGQSHGNPRPFQRGVISGDSTQK
jgi:DNA invertase Pin-like site-specific DNA recombinase